MGRKKAEGIEWTKERTTTRRGVSKRGNYRSHSTKDGDKKGTTRTRGVSLGGDLTTNRERGAERGHLRQPENEGYQLGAKKVRARGNLMSGKEGKGQDTSCRQKEGEGVKGLLMEREMGREMGSWRRAQKRRRKILHLKIPG